MLRIGVCSAAAPAGDRLVQVAPTLGCAGRGVVAAVRCHAETRRSLVVSVSSVAARSTAVRVACMGGNDLDRRAVARSYASDPRKGDDDVKELQAGDLAAETEAEPSEAATSSQGGGGLFGRIKSMWGGGGKATPASGSEDAGGAAGEDDELTRLGKNVSKELPADELATLERKVSNPGEYDLEAFGIQLKQMKIVGNLKGMKLAKKIPGLSKFAAGADPTLPYDEMLQVVEAMTETERNSIEFLNSFQIQQIAARARVTKDVVNNTFAQYRSAKAVQAKVHQLKKEGKAVPSSIADIVAMVKEERRANLNVGRNRPCPCGSGRTVKNCCGA